MPTQPHPPLSRVSEAGFLRGAVRWWPIRLSRHSALLSTVATMFLCVCAWGRDVGVGGDASEHVNHHVSLLPRGVQAPALHLPNEFFIERTPESEAIHSYARPG